MPLAVRLRHVLRLKHRDGSPRYLLRVPGCRAITLPGEPGSPAFMAAYNRAVEAAAAPAQRLATGSLDALAVSYYASPAFAGLRASTAAAYRRLVEELRTGYGTRPVRLLESRHIRDMISAKSAHPTAANHRLRMLRALMAHAVQSGLIRSDPTAGVERMRYRTDGYHTWTEDEIAAFEARWPPGTRERLAFALLLYTGQRRSDVVKLGRHSLREGRLWVRQQKTGAELLLPIHPALAAELATVPADRLLFLQTDSGAGFTAGGFYNAFAEWCADAGLQKGRSPHGLRKACARRLAEAGATAHQICAVLGWRRLSQAEVYTRGADQARMAADAMARLGGA